jgi:hypothetical protein
VCRGRATRQTERGASLVEFAFVIPIMLAFVMGLATYGLAEAGDNTGSSAAREGARVGIVNFENAHSSSSAARSAIDAAVGRHTGSGFVSNPSVSVRCVRPGSGGSIAPISGSGTCDPNVVQPGTDLIEVRVEWDPVGPVARPRRSELARMTIVGRPDLSDGSTPPPVDDDPNDDVPPEYEPDEPTVEPPPPPPDCVITGVTLDPNPVRIHEQQKKLWTELVYRAESNGAANCGEVAFNWGPNTHSTATTASDPVPNDNAYIGALASGTGNWTLGTNVKTVTAVAANGASFTLNFSTVPHNYKP